MSTHWYVIHSQANKEESLRRQLELKGLVYYYPTLRIKPVNPRSRKIRPFFPGYLFVSLDLDQANASELQWMPYSAGLVSFGGEPAQVPDHLIEALKRKLSANQSELLSPAEGLRAGDTVLIQDGPFAGFEAIFQAHLSGRERVQVLLKMLSSRNLPLDLPARQVTPKKR